MRRNQLVLHDQALWGDDDTRGLQHREPAISILESVHIG
jgi:hypothetical protein